MTIKVDEQIKEFLLNLNKQYGIKLEGNILKLMPLEDSNVEFSEYIKSSISSDKENRRKRLDITKQIQKQNNELLLSKSVNEELMESLSKSLEEAKSAKEEAEALRDNAIESLDVAQKKAQFELVNIIVKVALSIIVGVAITTTLLYMFAMTTNKDTQIVSSTWSNMFGILLTNAFSIIGTIMGIKYATDNK